MGVGDSGERTAGRSVEELGLTRDETAPESDHQDASISSDLPISSPRILIQS